MKALVIIIALMFFNACNAATTNKKISEREYLDYLKKKNQLINDTSKKVQIPRPVAGQGAIDALHKPEVPSTKGDPRSINKAVNDFISSKDPKAVDKLIDSPKDTTKTKLTKEDKKSIPKKSSTNLVVGRKAGKYFAVAASFIPYGSSGVTGGETHERAASGTETTSDSIKKTFHADVDYTFFLDANLRFGWNFPSFATLTFPAFFRIELEVGYDRLQTSIKNVGVASGYSGADFSEWSPGKVPVENPDPTFGVPANYGTGNMLHFGVNGYLDLVKWGPGYPYIGAGIALAVMIFDAYIQTNIIVPVFNIFAGYIFQISKTFQVSIGYKLTILFPTTFSNVDGYVIPMDWKGSAIDRPVIENLVSFDAAFIHKIEIGFYFF